MIQEVAGGVVVCEPVAVRVGPALVLAGPGCRGVAVAAHDVVLTELAGSHLKVLAARWPGCCCCCCRGLCCCCCCVGAGARRPGAAREVRLGGATGAAGADLRPPALAEEVTLGVKVCEPLALGAEPALLLALRGAVGEPVVTDDVVLGQVTGPLHKVRASVAISTCQKETKIQREC